MTAIDTPELADHGPIAQLRGGRLPARLTQLGVGLVLFGVSLACMVRADLGLAPWDVLHYGVTLHLPLSFGQTIVLVSFLTLLLWIPLREQPGVGTVANAIVVGTVADLSLRILPEPSAMWLRAVLLLVAVPLCGLASALYIGAQLGRGPRDGLMTGLHRRTGHSIRLVRTAIEVGVLLIGLLLGGTAGIGTVCFAFGIGALTHLMLPGLIIELPDAAGDPTMPDEPMGATATADERIVTASPAISAPVDGTPSD